ncbi:autotransporter outer membrane beta-barrel domain-containing protein [Pseudomonas sp. RT6P73]
MKNQFYVSPLHRLTCALTLLTLPPFFLASPAAFALTPIEAGETLDIDQTTTSDNYRARNGAVLNSNGASTFEVLIQSDATFNAEGGTYAGRLGNAGVSITNANGNLTNAIVTGDRVGMLVNRESGTATGSHAVIVGSQITGGRAGIETGGGSLVELTDTQVTATAQNGVGISSFGADVRVSGGRILADAVGVRMRADVESVGEGPRLVLDSALVQALTGSAILVDAGATAGIGILNNSTLLAGNGNLLDIQDASTANVEVDNSVLNGNVNIDGGSVANLVFNSGHMFGDVVLADDASSARVTLQNNSQFTGSLDKVDGVTINSGSNWTLTHNDTVGALAMNGGTVSFGAADAPNTFYQLNVGTLASSGTDASVFVMKGDFATGKHDFLNVTGVATGQFGLSVAASGLDAVSPGQLTLVHTEAGDAQFSLVSGRADQGTWSYLLKSLTNESGATDWYLDPVTQTVSPGARAILALFNTPISVVHTEDASLRSRMGELRFNGGRSGAWVRTFGSQYNVADGSGVAYQQTQKGFSLGADARLAESQWFLGLMAGYSKSDLNLDYGTSGTVESYYVGPYITWLDAASGYYFDAALKFNHFRNESKVGLSDGSRAEGDYDNSGLGGWAEFGRHIKFGNGFFIEPFTRFSSVVIQGKHYNLDNGMDADGDRARSMQGKVGSTFGRDFDFGNGKVVQPYISAAAGYEFAKNNEVQVNNNVFNNDLSGYRAEFGAGVAVALSETLQGHVDFNYEKGEHIEMPWRVNFGVRYNW